ncbi:M48 family metallopeptidase [Sulfurospirillum arcachonense]|uniref:M48 family metallopeptidase n=1 Tax=Sulfurospirillum arcachonense TaxID=57666 RepID=UPI000468D448|nr:M48 family metallopeptidase [Sulfurospirillum arcachonense]
MFEIILIIYTLYTIAKVYISIAESNFVLKAKEKKAIILSEKNYKEAAEYKIETSKISIVNSLYDLLLFFAWIGFGFKALDGLLNFDNSMIYTITFILSFIAINYILGLPFELYQTFNLDKRYGFSTIDVKTYIIDQIKGAVMFLVFGSLLIWLLAFIIGSFENWWIWGFGAVFIVILFINMIYPTLIAPIFNKFSPLDNEELQSSIENLLSKAGLKSSGVFKIDASKRDKRLNAYFGGLGKSKRVVLFDTLIKKLETKELLAVLGHELGHFKHGDIVKNIGASALMLFVMFAFFGNIPLSIYEGIGVEESAHMTLILFLLLSPVLSFLMMPLFGLLSRHNEYAADEYGSECESKEALASALTKLADENKSFPLSHPLTVAFYHTHPGLVERLERLGVNV